MNPEAISEFAALLGIEDAQLIRFHRKFRGEHGDEADAKLCSWLETTWKETRDQPRLPRARLPGGRPPKVTPPFKRGTPRSGVSRQEEPSEPKKPKRRSKPIKPPSLAEVKEAAEHSAYTANYHQALPDVNDEPLPDEVANYRASREARRQHEQEQLEEIQDLLAAMTELRGAINAMSREKQRKCGRSFWILRSRLDAAERDLRRRIAA